MNPGWLIAGLWIGERLSPHIREHGKTAVQESYGWLEDRAAPVLARLAYRRWLRSLPTGGSR